MSENKMEQVESLLIWLTSGEKDEDGNRLSDNDTQLVCDALEYYLNTHRQKNKMAQVAELFGKELGEEFMVRLKVGFEINCKFTNEGLKQEIVDGDWYDNDNFLRRLPTGEAEIVEDEK